MKKKNKIMKNIFEDAKHINGQSKTTEIMKNKDLALMAELKEQLKKAKADKNKFDNERKRQEYQLELESRRLRMETEILQQRIDNIKVERLKKKVPKYFCAKAKNEYQIVNAFKTREIVSDSEAISIIVDNIALYQDEDLHESRFACGYGTKLFLAYSIDGAVDTLDTDYIEITEDGYNKLKALSIEALVNGQIAKLSKEKADELRRNADETIEKYRNYGNKNR